MIIGKNTNLQRNNTFINQQNSNNSSTNNPHNIVNLTQNPAANHPDVMNKQDMNERAFSLLQERLNKGQISMEEFNRLCTKIGKIK